MYLTFALLSSEPQNTVSRLSSKSKAAIHLEGEFPGGGGAPSEEPFRPRCGVQLQELTLYMWLNVHDSLVVHLKQTVLTNLSGPDRFVRAELQTSPELLLAFSLLR